MSLSLLHPWLDRAWADLGLSASPSADPLEVAAAEARIRAYFAAVGHPEITTDETAWCAAFVGACLERSGAPSTRSLAARSYLAYGTPTTAESPGSIAIFSRGADPSLGHVAFVVGSTADAVIVLGGNQRHAVSVICMPRQHLLALRWPPDLAPAMSVPTRLPDQSVSKTAAATFDTALAHVLAMEGGYSDDPYDPGGPTNLGLTMADVGAFHGVADVSAQAAELKSAVMALTPADAAPIYRALYWTPCRAAEMPAAVALFHFDTAVNHGLGAAARMLQQALAVPVDGDIGPLTLAAANAADPTTLIAAYAVIRCARYRALPTFWRFGHGWLARVDATSAAADALIPVVHQPSTQEPPMPASTTLPDTPSSAASSTVPAAGGKWWGQSLTIWGTVITTLSTVLPIVGPVIGVDISAALIHQLGDGIVQSAQALGGVAGILMTIYGRVRAAQPLTQREFQVKL